MALSRSRHPARPRPPPPRHQPPRDAAQRARRGGDPLRRVRRPDHRHADRLLIRNTDQRSKDYGNLLDTFRPGHADYTYWQQVRPARPARRRPRVGAADRADGGRRRGGARSGCARSTAPRFVGWMTQLGEIEIPVRGLRRRSPNNPFFAANASDHRRSSRPTWTRCARPATRCGARIDVDGARRAGGPGRAAVRQARRRHRLRDDGHQRRQGRRDRRRLRRASRSAAASMATS